MADEVIIKRIDEDTKKVLRNIERCLARSSYIQTMATFVEFGMMSPDEYRKQAKTLMELQGFGCKEEFWNRENNIHFREEVTEMTETMKENIRELYAKDYPTGEIAKICDLNETDVVKFLEDDKKLPTRR